MDPDANLEEQKRIVKDLLKARDNGGWSSFEDVVRLCELVLSLDEWLSRGSTLPKAWNHEKT